MNLYNIFLFLHILGAMGIFTALGLEWMSLANLRRVTTTEQAREWLKIFPWLRRIGPASLATLLLAGLYLTFTAWGWVPWIIVSFLSMVLLPIFGASSGIRMARIAEEFTTRTGKLPTEIQEQLNMPAFWISLRLRTVILLGIVFLMTTKLALMGSLMTMGAALVLGFLLNLIARRNPTQFLSDQSQS